MQKSEKGKIRQKYLEILTTPSQKIDFDSKSKKFGNVILKLEKNRSQLIRRLSPPLIFLNSIDLIRYYAFFRLYRRQVWARAEYFSANLFKEIGKRLNLSNDELLFLTPLEIEELLLGKRKSARQTISKRKKYCLLLMKNKKIKIYSSEKAMVLAKKEIAGKIDLKKKVLRGTCASSGSAVGKVKIIQNTKQMERIEKGDILIAQNITPDFMVAIKKAAAIASEMGGLTCHAAIISRELKIPCVVGVKHLTEILKDGERVKINASAGIIKRI